MTGIMEQVVERAHARAAQILRLHDSGKTGTAAQVVNGRYSTTQECVRS
jgi:cell division protein FtsI/penicillin-binding protein 2